MTVFADGSGAGTLGGGCVEAAVKRRALQAMATGQACIEWFELADDYGFDDGLICGGRMAIAIEPAGEPQTQQYFESMLELLSAGNGGLELIAIDSDNRFGLELCARLLFGKDGQLVAMLRTGPLPDELAAVVAGKRGRHKPWDEAGVAFVPISARCRLVLIGAGHIAQAVAELAAKVEFDVWVVDDRSEFACQERFPTAKRIVLEEIGEATRSLQTDARTYCVIVTRGHRHDELALLNLVRKPLDYLGMIGSKRKVRLIFLDLLAAGIEPELLERVHAPIGLDIGAHTVPEIAVSIVAELIEHRNVGHEACQRRRQLR